MRPALPEPHRRAYLRRLGLDDQPTPTLAGLRLLHAAHLRHVPFENLSIHLGEEIVLESDALVTKIVDRGRGGFCYELNGAFAALLAALGFEVTLLAARVHGTDGLGPPFDHMCLRVDLDEPWLADVGFGDNFVQPLRLHAGGDQIDDAGTFRLEPAGEDELDLLRDGRPQYRFDLTPRALADYGGTCSHHQTSPASHFTRGTVCSMLTSEGRMTIAGRTLITTTAGDRDERALDDDELLDAYRRHFGIVLDRVPQVRNP